MTFLIKIIKFLGVIGIIVGFMFSSLIIVPFHRKHWDLVKKRSKILSFWCRVALKLLSIKVEFTGLSHFGKKPNWLIVSNHLSYLDVLVISSRIRTSFVTSVEVKEDPI